MRGKNAVLAIVSIFVIAACAGDPGRSGASPGTGPILAQRVSGKIAGREFQVVRAGYRKLQEDESRYAIALLGTDTDPCDAMAAARALIKVSVLAPGAAGTYRFPDATVNLVYHEDDDERRPVNLVADNAQIVIESENGGVLRGGISMAFEDSYVNGRFEAVACPESAIPEIPN